MDFYTLEICGLTRQLPLVYVGRKLKLATFNFLGDIELVDRLADQLAEKLKKQIFDYLVCPHVKVTPLVHGVGKRLGHTRFVVCRKTIKSYMTSPVILKPPHHFPSHVKSVVINGRDRELLHGKKVIVIDDVVSTGLTLKLTNLLLQNIGAAVVLNYAVFKQGDLSNKSLPNLHYISKLPIFPQIVTDTE